MNIFFQSINSPHYFVLQRLLLWKIHSKSKWMSSSPVKIGGTISVTNKEQFTVEVRANAFSLEANVKISA